jgi:hypothetical protein
VLGVLVGHRLQSSQLSVDVIYSATKMYEGNDVDLQHDYRLDNRKRHSHYYLYAHFHCLYPWNLPYPFRVQLGTLRSALAVNSVKSMAKELGTMTKMGQLPGKPVT